MTHKQFEAWQAWLQEEWNKPSRADHYAMRISNILADKTLDPIAFEFVEPVPERDSKPPEGFTGYWPKRLSKEDVERAKEKISKGSLLLNLGRLGHSERN